MTTVTSRLPQTARHLAVTAALALVWIGCSGSSPVGGELEEAVPLGLTFHYDPATQGHPFLNEIVQADDYDCYFTGTTVFTRTPPSIAVDGSGADCRSRNMLSTLGFGSDNAHTLFVVVKPTLSGTVNSYVFDRLKNRADIIYGYLPGKFEYFVEENGFTGPDYPRAGTAIAASLNQWQTIAYSVGSDGSNKQQRGYKNGVLTVGPLTKNFNVAPLNGWITLGNSAPGYNGFAGQIGHVFWWDRQLSDDEIQVVHAWVRDKGGFSGLLP